MYTAFTKELKYDRFGCGATEEQAIEQLTLELEREYGRFTGADSVAVVVEEREIDIVHPSFEFGHIYTSFVVIKVDDEGVAQYGEQPKMCGGWDI
jgi:hypothetical protein